MKQPLRRALDSTLQRLGYDRVRRSGPVGVHSVSAPASASLSIPPDIDPDTARIIDAVAPYTLTSPERVFALCEAVRYLVRAGVPGAFAECGVWRGGSSLAMVHTLLSLGVTDRDLYLYDTFDHMPAPGPQDVDYRGVAAIDNHAAVARGVPTPPAFDYLPYDEVRAAFAATGYPAKRLHFVVGLVEDTVPLDAPDTIALLRLDTDYYQSTVHELTHLAPRIPVGGVLLIDDYGHFLGCRQAVDEYVAQAAEHNRHLFLARIDYSGRLIVMPPGLEVS
jgi:O-methyltransferase